jgi:hypothetical protein
MNLKHLTQRISSSPDVAAYGLESAAAGHFEACGLDRRSPNATPAEHARGRRRAVEFKFLDELKRRNIARVGILYMLLCWFILEPVRLVLSAFQAQAWADRWVLITMTIGFAAVLLFAWVYELTPAGLKPTAEVDRRQSITKQTGQCLDWAIIAVIAVALAYVVVTKFRL